MVEQDSLALLNATVGVAGTSVNNNHGKTLNVTAGHSIDGTQSADAKGNSESAHAPITGITIGCVSGLQFVDRGNSPEPSGWVWWLKHIEKRRNVISWHRKKVFDP